MASDKKFVERLKTIEVQLERLANDVFLSDPFVEGRYGSLWRPSTDVYETDDAVVVRMEAPGLLVEDISVTLHGSSLVVRGMRRDRHPDIKKRVLQLEVHYGLFERVIPLPETIRYEEADAGYVDGFLVVTIPKCEEPGEPNSVVRLRI